jgi:hypothetical protein
MRSSPLTLVVLLLASCTGKEPEFGTPIGGGGGDGTPDDTASDTGDSGGDTGDSGDTGAPPEGQGGFEFPGDSVTFTDESGDAEVDLTDVSEEPGSNRDQEFFLILVNTAEEALGYQLRYGAPSGEGEGGESEGSAGAGGPPRASGPAGKPVLSAARAALRAARQAGRVRPVEPPAMAPPPFTDSDIGVARQEFRVRSSVDDDEAFAVVDARLWAVGESVAIWVDDDLAIDWDMDCADGDPAVDVVDPRGAFGFDNCDLQTIADIVDTNIIPNIRAIYGEESDVNGDGKVSVVVTPVLNYMTLFTEDETLEGELVGSYADPEVDLNAFDVLENPMSDEQEVIFVHAPDPLGFLNPNVPVGVDAYTATGLSAEIARAFTRLVSYNYKVIVNGLDPEETWVVEGLAALAADFTGFGSVSHGAAWEYLDAPHLKPLVLTDEGSAISSVDEWGAQYLFFRWLHDTQASTDTSFALLTMVVQGVQPGTAGIEAAAGKAFSELVLGWQVALLTTGVTGADGNPLLSETDDFGEPVWPPFAASTTLSAPTERPDPGDYYGANGYQQGINVRGDNRTFIGGTTASPVEDEDARVRMDGTDHTTMVTGYPFYGYVAENYGAQVIRLSDIPLDAASLFVDAAGTGYTGVVIRWKDATAQDLAVEDIFSSTDANSLRLPALPEGGERITAVGGINLPGAVTVVPTSGASSTAEVQDTDRWLLDLTDRPITAQVEVAIWLERHFENTDGDLGLFDPWVAVVPSSLVPTPTVSGTRTSACPGSAAFAYPISLLEHLNAQLMLSGSSGASGVSADFDACGVPADTATTCANDFDGDGVLDEAEPAPQSFLEQVQVQQCTLAGGDATAFTPADSSIFDLDEVDEDEESEAVRAYNVGGRSGEDGEDALLLARLSGGQTYTIIVGGAGDTGTYELTLRTRD